MERKSVHEFHLVMNKGLKEKVKEMDLFKGVKGLSEKIVRILSVLMPVISKEHKWGNQRFSRYLPVCGDPEEIREDVHVYVPEALYRRLKLLHQDLNVFSIAQLVREFLEFFLGLVERYGNDIFFVLKKVFEHWQQEDGVKNLSLRDILRQLLTMLTISLHIPQGNRIISIYDSTFSPFWILQI